MIGTARAVGLGALAMLVACGKPKPPVLRLMSQNYSFVVQSSEIPPRADDQLVYTITVRDRKTHEPIENGLGQIFADMGQVQGPHTWDGFTPSAQLGTYTAKLRFAVAGQWAMAIRFQRDSLHPLERVDWMQDVFTELPDSTP